MEHTKEPWVADDFRSGDSSGASIYAGQSLIAIVAGANYGEWRDADDGGEAEFHANARRIVACVNALAGYNPDAVADVVAAAEGVVRGASLRQTGASDGSTYTWAGPTPAAIADLDAALARLRSIDNA